MKESEILELTGEMTNSHTRYTNDLHEIDFTVVYESIHIHEYLHCKEDFVRQYKEIRTHYCDPNSLANCNLKNIDSNEFLANYPSILFRVMGFFITELSLIQQHASLFSIEELQSLWHKFWNAFDIVLKAQIPLFDDPKNLFQMRVYIIIILFFYSFITITITFYHYFYYYLLLL